jgi:hypothetical protein
MNLLFHHHWCGRKKNAGSVDLPNGTCGVFFIEALSAFPNST